MIVRHRVFDPADSKAPLFPHAHYRYWREVPDRCDRCGGASWRRVEEGVSCVLCPRSRIVAEALMEARAARRLRGEPTEPPGRED